MSGPPYSGPENPDLPPPRYTANELVMDEAEWLARPNVWGIGELPEPVRERKRLLYDFYHHSWLTSFLQCAVCRRSLLEQYREDCVLVGRDADDIRRWYDETHPPDKQPCDAWRVWKLSLQYHRGIISPTECRNASVGALYYAVHASPTAPPPADRPKWREAMLLELVGPNPFRPIAIDPTWRTTTTVAIAQEMYESRDFSPMPILADALQDAGCENADVLNHCRDPQQVHVRGCWVVDFVLGKT